MSREVFLTRYCFEEDGYISIVPGKKSCPFLEDRRCKIYPVRPTQCATWPFWDDNMMTESKWEGTISDCCEGIGRGTPKPRSEIDKICRKHRKASSEY